MNKCCFFWGKKIASLSILFAVYPLISSYGPSPHKTISYLKGRVKCQKVHIRKAASKTDQKTTAVRGRGMDRMSQPIFTSRSTYRARSVSTIMIMMTRNVKVKGQFMGQETSYPFKSARQKSGIKRKHGYSPIPTSLSGWSSLGGFNWICKTLLLSFTLGQTDRCFSQQALLSVQSSGCLASFLAPPPPTKKKRHLIPRPSWWGRTGNETKNTYQ